MTGSNADRASEFLQQAATSDCRVARTINHRKGNVKAGYTDELQVQDTLILRNTTTK